ncbi:polysaccharide biosynthesis tyrosine autokinase, partial [Streptococcus pneumoniae]|nr:polysaccharide biosynthesis tyrosine autokinase [Streptococcus pneumoniae]
LYILQAGVVSPNPLSLLRSVKFETLIDSMKKYFDYIIVDTPPIGQVIDAAIIAQQCDGIFLVTEMRKTTRRQIFSSLQQLEQTGVPVLGLV